MKPACMNKLYKHLFTTFFLLLIFTGFPSLVHAQIIDPGCDPLDPYCPIDGGIGFLLAAGAAYGLKKIRNSLKKDASGL